jgi:small subunit ribosomal protein S18
MKLRPVAKNCPFCENDTLPDYKETSLLQKFLTERGKIIGRARTGLCNKHQKSVTVAVKRARFMALLPYLVRS